MDKSLICVLRDGVGCPARREFIEPMSNMGSYGSVAILSGDVTPVKRA